MPCFVEASTVASYYTAAATAAGADRDNLQLLRSSLAVVVTPIPPGLPMGCFGLDMYEKMFGPTSAEYPFGRDCWYGIQKDPVVVYWPSVFLEAWGTKAKKPHFFQKILVYWPCRIRRQSQKTSIFLNKYCFLALVPQASKKPLGQ